MGQKFCLHIHSKRRRLADPDGISFKAAIDGLTEGGILRDDSAKVIERVTSSQEVVKGDADEETIIDVEIVQTVGKESGHGASRLCNKASRHSAQ